MSARVNNTTWNDKDVTASVSGHVSTFKKLQEATKGVGQHPSKIKKG
jgi:hypothetical protein